MPKWHLRLSTTNFALQSQLSFYVIIFSTKGDISGNHKDYRVTATEKVNGTKVTFKGGEKMVYLAGWTKDGQNHAMYFERPVNRDMAKAIIANTVAPTAHTAYTK